MARALGSALAVVALLLVGAGPARAQGSPQPPRYGPWGFDLSGADPATRPGDDFFRHCNGAWLDRTPIPADRSWMGVDVVLAQLVEARMRLILEAGPEGVAAEAREEARKIGDFYASFMDEAAIEALDLAPVADDLSKLRAAATHEDLAELIGRLGTFNKPPFSLAIYPDNKAPDRYAVYLGQSGLGLPDRDYYLEAAFAPKKAAYEAYVAELLGMAGWPDPKEAAARVLALETEIAAASWTQVEARDSDRTYNPVTLQELEASAPFPWRRWLKPLRLDARTAFVALEDSAIRRIAAIYARTPLDVLKAQQAFSHLDGAAPLLSRRFVDAQFRFRSQALDGVAEQKERWKRAAGSVAGAMGEAVGRVYVARYFPETAKRQVEGMVDDVRAALHDRLGRTEWMSPETRTRAQDKLARLSVQVGYPKVWRDYSGLEVTRDGLVPNVRRAMIFEWLRTVRRLDEPVDREEWTTTPQTVNAYYTSNLNEMTLPAAELQPPKFDPTADAAVNYGGIGAIIGHELIHGFDDDGRKYDGAGILKSWWSEADVAAFTARAAELARQYDRFEIFPGAFVNGQLTLGENIADLGGALVALDAYRRSLGGKPAPVIDGLTGEQRFFLGFAQSWRAKTREDAQRRLLVSDPHAPDETRVNGAVRNIDAWYEAFGVKPGDKLYLPPEKRVRLW